MVPKHKSPIKNHWFQQKVFRFWLILCCDQMKWAMLHSELTFQTLVVIMLNFKRNKWLLSKMKIHIIKILAIYALERLLWVAIDHMECVEMKQSTAQQLSMELMLYLTSKRKKSINHLNNLMELKLTLIKINKKLIKWLKNMLLKKQI